MKKAGIRKITGMIPGVVLVVGLLSGCGRSNDAGRESGNTDVEVASSTIDSKGNNESTDNTESTNNIVNTDIASNSTDNSTLETSEMELEVRFGDMGEPFIMNLYDNDTAATIEGYVGTSDWRLPIYERDDLDHSVLQYYDIPSRYEIPSNPETVTSQKAGEVYYSDPNRIVLFYHDAEVEGEYTLIGYFDVTDEFITAVGENPVLEGWGNKILQISQP